MRLVRLLFLLAALLLLLGSVALPSVAAPPMQRGNVLRNPRFEQSLEGWSSWYYEDLVIQATRGPDKGFDLQRSFFQPAFSLSEPKWAREATSGKAEDHTAGRVSGRAFTKFRAGYFQTAYVAPGSHVVFTVWANGISEDEIGTRGAVRLRAGIDPMGGSDWRSPNIRWVETYIDDQEYEMLITPQVQAPSGVVTVFVWGEPRYPVIYNAAYFDDANLVVTIPPTPTGAAPTAPPPPPTPTPCAQMRVVSETMSPGSMAVTPGTRMVKTWRVQNSGTCAWSGALDFVGSGNRMGNSSPIVVPMVQPGASVDISLDLIAPPEPGAYQGTWQIRADDGTILGRMVVAINVINATATPQPVQVETPGPVAPASPTASQICVLAFNDRNGDGQRSADEGLLAGAVFALAIPDGTQNTYSTDAVHEPHCFSNLQAGYYTLAVKLPAAHRATTPDKMIVYLFEGARTDLAFGGMPGEPVATSTRSVTVGSSAVNIEMGTDSTRRIGLTTAALLVLFNLGLVIWIAMRRRSI